MEELTEDIVARASQGDINAFEQVYCTYASFVYNVAYRVGGTREDAEEITQEVFLTLHHKLSSFQYKSSLKTWIYRITVNSAINALKKKNRENKDLVYIDEAYECPDGNNAVRQEIDNQDNQHKVERLLALLNPDERACIVLRNIEGLSYEEISMSLNVNINTVRTRLKRAREKMLSGAKEVIADEV